ncbi:cytosine deaminase [Burkholderia stagnalis]|uniref:amidohydrolase family protein n=1 Tax=Burkholderia stagnalis TaxID=1503054 RepID=UPI000F58C128|nr:amidohydrolase family protein [Burkholderia stagnalis]RQQ04643.1 cytosine deaminase [Burkholderia stagnalis]RQQ13146.1 cytosine deaminase [Burkholderia stagnalis]RQQ27822.1 cytosine deaminase [Burkholderia stagnalis]RQQ31374.1 cytosine deaminase [Burkholderia stagnalis]RQQ31969.1 cytosine deaminase [Burkholderia stagnalis]
MTTSSSSLLISDVRLPDGSAAAVSIEGGRIAAIGPGVTAAPGATVEDGRGALLLPGFVEGHTHIDKSNWGRPWYRNEVGPALTDRIGNEREWRKTSGHDAAAQSLALSRAFVAAGTTRLRTHVDIDTDGGLRYLDGVLQTRQTLADALDMQIVALPQSGVLIRPGTVELLSRALDAGADVLGALDPALIDRDPAGSLDATFALAERHRKPIDIHLHEPGEVGAFTLNLLLDRVAAHGMQGQVVVSHGFCLGALPERERDALLDRIASLNVALLTSAPASCPVPPLKACRERGITLFGGNDGIRDTWSPYNVPDMLERAMLIGMRYDLRRDDDLAIALDCVTDAGARGCGFADYGLRAGARADLVLVDAETVAHAIVARPVRRLVVANGRIVARDGAFIGA